MTKGNGNASQYFCNRRNINDWVAALKNGRRMKEMRKKVLELKM